MQENSRSLVKFQALFRGYSCRNLLLKAQLQYCTAAIEIENSIKSLHAGYSYEKHDQYSYIDMINAKPLFPHLSKSAEDRRTGNSRYNTASLNILSTANNPAIKNKTDSTNTEFQDKIVKLNDAIRNRISVLKGSPENA